MSVEKNNEALGVILEERGFGNCGCGWWVRIKHGKKMEVGINEELTYDLWENDHIVHPGITDVETFKYFGF